MTKSLLSVLFLIGVSCSSSSGGTDTETLLPIVVGVSLTDVGNAANSSDIELAISVDDVAGISELRAFIVKASVASQFDIAQANQSTHFQRILLIQFTNGAFRANMEADIMDTDGAPVQNDLAYVVFVASIPDASTEAESRLSSASNNLTLRHESYVSTLTAPIQAGSGGMDVDAAGNIYMGNFGLNLGGGGSQVYKITPEGVVNTFTNASNGASGNDFDSNGNLFQSSITGGFVSQITPDGQVSTYVSTNIAGPVGVVALDDGTLYVANCGNHTIQRVNTNQVASLFSNSPLLSGNCPNGIDVDADGNVYTALFSNGNIIKITPDGTASVFATLPGGNNGHLLVRGDLMYVVARTGNQIYTIPLSGGTPQVLAGTGTRGLRNGPLNQATFSLPNDLAFSPDGSKIYINDVSSFDFNTSIISPVVIRVIHLVN